MSTKNVLILGSAADATDSKKWETNIFDSIVAINNAWKIREDWTFNIFPTDFPIESRPKPNLGQQLITASEYVTAQNLFGGFVYGGGTMAFTAAYWALAYLKPTNIFFFGCDMIYSKGKTHFYGKGKADPLRKDITLRSLEAKSARFECHAYLRGCQVFNLSKQNESRLVYRRRELKQISLDQKQNNRVFFQKKISSALLKERELNYYISDGKYWKQTHLFDEKEIDVLDSLWLNSIKLS